MGPFPRNTMAALLKERPGDDAATTFRNKDLKKRLREVSGLKLEENLELNVDGSK